MRQGVCAALLLLLAMQAGRGDVRPLANLGRGDVDAAAAVALARPLFSPSRRPAAAPAPMESATRPAEPPCLRGTIVSAAGSVALFGATAMVAARAVGETIEGWRVDAVGAGEARLTSPPGSVVRAVSFCGRPGVAVLRKPPSAPPAGVNEMGDETPQLSATFKNPTPLLALPLLRH